VADIAHEVIYRLKEGNSTKWLFLSSLTVCLESPITSKQNEATGLVIAPPVWELTDFLPQNTPKSTKTAILSASGEPSNPLLCPNRLLIRLVCYLNHPKFDSKKSKKSVEPKICRQERCHSQTPVRHNAAVFEQI
jgi:hypothetical protein